MHDAPLSSAPLAEAFLRTSETRHSGSLSTANSSASPFSPGSEPSINAPYGWFAEDGQQAFLTDDAQVQDAVEFSKRASIPKTASAILKAFIGSGILVLPEAFYNGGVGFSVFALSAICLLCLTSMLLLTEVGEALEVESYGAIAHRSFNSTGAVIISSSIVLSQLGFCCVYAIFVAKTTSQLLSVLAPASVAPPAWLLIYAQALVYVPLVWIRRIRYLSPLVVAADSLIGAGLLLITLLSLVVCVKSYGAAFGDVTWGWKNGCWQASLGVFVYAWEGVALVLPIKASMQDHLKPEFPRVLVRTLCSALCGILIFSLSGVFAFGGNIHPLVVANVADYFGPIATVIQVGYGIAIVFTYPLQFFPAAKAIESVSSDHCSNDGVRKGIKNVSRTLMVFVTLSCSYLGLNSIDRCVSLIGSLCCLPLALIFPPLIHLHALTLPKWLAYRARCVNQDFFVTNPSLHPAWQVVADALLLSAGIGLFLFTNVYTLGFL